MPSSSVETSNAIGKLCVSGDDACAEGDFATLGSVVELLEGLMPEPVHCELAAVAAACTADPERAVMLWDRLKSNLYRRVS